MKKIKIVLISSLALNLVIAGFVGVYFYKKYKLAHTRSYDLYSYTYNRDKLYTIMPTDSNSICFLGNSLTQFFDFAEFFNDRRIKNRGIAGDHTFGVLQRIESIIQMKPSKIFIEIGINDLQMGIPLDSIAFNYNEILVRLQSECTQTQLFVQSILPTQSYNREMPSFTTTKINEEIRKLNTVLKKLCQSLSVTFIDLHPLFLENGYLKESYTVDGVHLSGEGYLIWMNELKPYLAK